MKLRHLYNKLSMAALVLVLATPLLSSAIEFTQAVNVRLNGRSLGHSKKTEDVSSMYFRLIETLKSSKESSAHLEINGSKFHIQLPALGEGKRGIVFSLFGTNSVIKIPKGTEKDFETLLGERQAAQMWEQARQQYKSSFNVLHNEAGHPEGLFAVNHLIRGETLGEFLFRYNLLTLDKTTGQAQISKHVKDIMTNDGRVQKVFQAVFEMIEAARRNPGLALSLSPHNIMVDYGDERLATIRQVSLVDVGLSQRAFERYALVTSIEEYLGAALESINKDIELGRHHRVNKSFEEIQKDPASLTARNLRGEVLRIAGLTPDVYELFQQTLSEVSKSHPEIQVVDGFFYGSRVMPRSEVNLRENKIFLPVSDDGVQKNSVRISGLQTLSDLESIVLVDSKEDLSADRLQLLKAEFAKRWAEKFKRFPISVRFFSKPPGVSYISPVAWATQGQALRNIPMPLSQYVKFSDVQIARQCSRVFH